MWWTSSMPSALAQRKKAAAAVAMTRVRLAHYGQNGCTAQTASATR